MGLIKFLKEKFSRKKKEEVKTEEVISETISNEVETEKHSGTAEILENNSSSAEIFNELKVETKSEDKNEKTIKNTAEPASFSKKEDNLQKYDDGLAKSRKGFADKLKFLSKKYKKVNQDYFDDLEEVLIEADVGVGLTLKIIQQLFDHAKSKKVDDAEELNDLLVDMLFENYMKEDVALEKELKFEEGKTTICLVVGVNGVGKTTSIAKLANRYKNQGKKILMVAGDTFRAGAKEQLQIWADRVGVPLISGKDNQDPASVVFDGLRKAKNENYDLIIVDTAGRLQNKINLMNELAKINRVIEKELPDSIKESLLIIDATTGQNGVRQARSFYDVTSLSGIIITKMDGTSKGGIILAIRDELGIPVRFIGLGEKVDDLQPFDLEKYLYSLCVSEN